MPAARSRIDRPASRLVFSIAGALAIHAVVIALAWPFVRPLMVRAFGPTILWKPPVDTSADDSPIITGSLSTATPAVEEPDYISQPWSSATVISPAEAHLPFSFVQSLRIAGPEAIAPPPRLSIAPLPGGPTIRR